MLLALGFTCAYPCGRLLNRVGELVLDPALCELEQGGSAFMASLALDYVAHGKAVGLAVVLYLQFGQSAAELQTTTEYALTRLYLCVGVRFCLSVRPCVALRERACLHARCCVACAQASAGV